MSTITKNLKNNTDEHNYQTLKALLDGVLEGIITINKLGIIESFNKSAEEIFLYSADEIIGENINILMPEPYKSEHDNYLLNYIKSNNARVIGKGREVIGKRKDNSIFPMDLSVCEIKSDMEDSHFVGVVRDITKRKRYENEVALNHALVNCISEVQSCFIRDEDPHIIFDMLLNNMLFLTESEYGFIGEILYTEENKPYLKTYAITDIAWDSATKEFYEKGKNSGLEFFNLNTLFGHVITSKKILISNNPGEDPHSGGLPEGHPPLNAFLGFPIMHKEDIIGMIGLSNRPGGYNSELLDFINPIITTCSYIIEAIIETRQKSIADERLKHANTQLNRTIHEMEQSTREISLLNEFENILQNCKDYDEAWDAVSRIANILFPECSGALYFPSDNSVYMEIVSQWGNTIGLEKEIEADDCIAIRKGQPHISGGPHTLLKCRHLTKKDDTPSLCIPLVAQSEILGVFFIEVNNTGDSNAACMESKKDIAITAATQIAMAVANIKLRKKLIEQSIRDPLTGLYNRRYLEDALERDLSQAQRNNSHPVSILIIDIDNFKQINDTYGHQAGDQVLKSIANIMRHHCRQHDLVSRLGGDEFVISLTNADTETAKERADNIRRDVLNMRISETMAKDKTITISIGISNFPLNSRNWNQLLKAADKALYKAKIVRNCVVVYDPGDSLDNEIV